MSSISLIEVFQKTGNWYSTQQKIDNYYQNTVEEEVQRRLAEEKENEAMWGQPNVSMQRLSHIARKTRPWWCHRRGSAWREADPWRRQAAQLDPGLPRTFPVPRDSNTP